MPKQKTAKPDKEPKPEGSEGLAKRVAVKVGAALGVVAATAGLAREGQKQAKRMVDGKFQKSQKHRLPRKQKKARMKQESQSAPL